MFWRFRVYRVWGFRGFYCRFFAPIGLVGVRVSCSGFGARRVSEMFNKGSECRFNGPFSRRSILSGFDAAGIARRRGRELRVRDAISELISS